MSTSGDEIIQVVDIQQTAPLGQVVDVVTAAPTTVEVASVGLQVVDVVTPALMSVEVASVGLQGPQGPAAHDPVTSYPFTLIGALGVLAGTIRMPVPLQGTILSVIATVAVAPTGSAAVIDVLKNGQSIFAGPDRPTIAAGSVVSNEATPDVRAVAPGDYLTVDVVQVGSVQPGYDLCVVVAVVHSG